jgi:hypothetical protein
MVNRNNFGYTYNVQTEEKIICILHEVIMDIDEKYHQLMFRDSNKQIIAIFNYEVSYTVPYTGSVNDSSINVIIK